MERGEAVFIRDANLLVNLAQTKEKEEMEGQGASNHSSKGPAARDGLGWIILPLVALGALRALPRY